MAAKKHHPAKKSVTPGYSGTPLVKRPGFKPPLTALTRLAPREYREWLGPLPPGVTLTTRLFKSATAVHLFTARREHGVTMFVKYAGPTVYLYKHQ